MTINGSLRKNGNTARTLCLLEAELNQLASAFGVELIFEHISLRDINLQYCRGCRTCFDRGEDKCPIKDDLASIQSKMANSDGLIAASPVYVNDVSGIMKTWLDRLAYLCHRPALSGKCALTVATIGVWPVDHTLNTLDFALSSWGYYLAGHLGIKGGALSTPEQILQLHDRQIKKAAAQLFFAIYQQKSSSPSFMSLMTFSIQQRYWRNKITQPSLDGDYWLNKGWTHPQCTYYIPTKNVRFKTALARLIGWGLSYFVT
ncbi:MAG: flavodoxin family protein [Anaerolineae bacterium]|nr:flavodoxin family protein [Anaerolineae bacterium]